MHDQSAPESSPTLTGGGARWFLTATAIAGYGLTVFGGFVPAMTGAVVSAIAMIALGAALYIYTNTQLGPVTAQPRLAGRAQAVQRRYRTLAIASAGALYLALVVGALVTDRRAVWDCLALPFCPAPSDLALIAMTHRVLAALATLLMAVLAFQTWRVRPERALRRAAGWSFGLMLLQNAVGIAHLLLVRNRNDIAFTQGAHLALGAIIWALLVVLATRALRPPLVRRDAGEQSGKVSNTPSTASGVQLFHGSAARIKDYMSLTKPGVITLLMLTTVAAMCITPAGLPSPELVFWTMIGGWLMPSGAHALNCYFDRDIDIKMGRTGRRPLPGNRIPAWHALVLGIVLAALAFVILAMFVNLLTAVLALAGYVYYVGIYTLWLKRRSPSNIVIGGGAGAFPPLVGWAAVTGGLTLPSLFLFAIIFYWTPPHFWALALIRQKDYANAGVPMLPVVAGEDETRRQIVLYTIQMVSLSLLLTPLHIMGLPYLLMALALGAIFTRYALRLRREGTTGAAWRLYKFSLLYLALLFGAMVADRIWLA